MCRTFQELALERLIKWGQASLETSINQPVLPHAVIAFNGAELDGKEVEWNEEYATETILSSVSHCLTRVPYLRELASIWRSRGRSIGCVSELIHCYYSSFTVVRIPTEGRPNLMSDQVEKLRKVISRSCEASVRSKRSQQASMKCRSYLPKQETSQSTDTPGMIAPTVLAC